MNGQELGKKEMYKMCLSDTNTSIKNVADGTQLEVWNYCEYEDVDSKGNTQHLLSLKTDSGYFTTNSETFIRNFLKIADLFEDEGVINIVKVSGVTKSDKPFVNVTIAD
jgi:hypothetical protein